MLPVSQLTAAALAPAAGADALAAAEGAVVGAAAVRGRAAALEPELEHAATTSTAAKATAVRRFGVERGHSRILLQAHASWRAGGLGAARLGTRSPALHSGGRHGLPV